MCSLIRFSQLICHSVHVFWRDSSGAIFTPTPPDQLGGYVPMKVFLTHQIVFSVTTFSTSTSPVGIPAPTKTPFPTRGHAP